MFTILTASKTIHRAFKPATVYSQTRGIMRKNENNILSNYLKKKFPSYTVENIQKLNLAPKDYEVVYINQGSRWLIAGIWTFYMLGASAVSNFSGYFTDPDWLDKEGILGKTNPGLGLLIVFQMIIIYIAVTKNVRYIYRNNEHLKYVFYNIFGSVKVVDQTVCTCEPPKGTLDMFHYLNNRSIIIIPKYFLKEEEYHLTLKPVF